MNTIPLSDQVLIEPIELKSAFSSSQKQYAERGRILAISESLPAGYESSFKEGDTVRFHGWAATFFEEDGKDYCLVGAEHIKGKENEQVSE